MDARRAMGYYPPSGELHLEEWAQKRYLKRKTEAQTSTTTATPSRLVSQTNHIPLSASYQPTGNFYGHFYRGTLEYTSLC
jgi:hypothetical protein